MQDSGNGGKALVTGGLGFIGSHLVERLLEEGREVVVVDNSATGKESNLAGVADDPRLSLVHADVVEYESMRHAFRGVEVVFHLAALAAIVPSIERPLDYVRANVMGTANVLEACRLAGVRRVIYAASSSCYGIADEYPTPETAAIVPEYPYALSKTLGEQLLLHWGRVYGMDVLSLRLFNVYGPRSRTDGAYGAVLGVFLAQKLAGAPLTIVGDGEQTRDFTYVTDVAEAMAHAAESEVSGEALNVGSGGTYSVNRLADLIGGDRVHVPKRPGEPDKTFADISKIQDLLGWAPRVTFEEGVKRTLNRIEDWRTAPVWDAAAIGEHTRAWFKYLGTEKSER